MAGVRTYTILAGVGFLAGVGLGAVWLIPSGWVAGYFLISVLAVSCLGWRWRHLIWPVGWCLVFVILGNWRLSVAQIIPSTDASHYVGQIVTLDGMVVSDPEVSAGGASFTLAVKLVEEQATSGRLLVKTTAYPSYKYGNALKITGQLTSPASNDQSGGYARYLSRYNIYAIVTNPEIQIRADFAGKPVWRGLYGVKHYFLTKINQVLPEPTSGLLAGLLLGISSVLPKNLLDSFNATGLTHIVALSGFNISVVSGAILSLLRWLPLPVRLSIAIISIWLFVLITGGAPSALRAAIMGMLILTAQLVGRLADITISLILTAVAMVLWNPKILGSDVGFQLSFLATVGIIYLNPALQQIFKRWPVWLRGVIFPTLSALVMVTPILVTNFGRLSLIAPLSNILVVPLVPVAMLLGFWALVGDMIQTDLGLMLGWIAWAPLKLIVVLTKYFSNFSWSSIQVDIQPGFWMLIYYLGIASLLIIFYARQKPFALEPLRPTDPR